MKKKTNFFGFRYSTKSFWLIWSFVLIVLFYSLFFEVELADLIATQEEGMEGCDCFGETLCLKTDAFIGKTFRCSLRKYLQRFQLTDYALSKAKTENFTFDDVIFVAYSSSNHFEESRQMLIDFRRQYANRIVFYDLGLTNKKRNELTKVCNLEIRVFDFSAYPKHVRNLRTYAFKPIIQAEIMLEATAFWTADTSVQFKNYSILQNFYNDVMSEKAPDYMIGERVGKEVPYTHSDMFKYLPKPTKDANQRSATVLFLRRSQKSKRLMKWLILCAMTKECIAPRGAYNACAIPPRPGCHRFDQSATSILFRTFYPPNSTKGSYYQECATVERGIEYKNSLRKINC